MVDAEELAKCFDADQLRGDSPIRSFTREERRVIATALRELRATPRLPATPQAGMREALEHTVLQIIHATSGDPKRVREATEVLCVALQSPSHSGQTNADAIPPRSSTSCRDESSGENQ